MGVSGSSAEYLINACDKFIFYDLLNETSPEAESEKNAESPKKVSFDLSEARLLLRRALNMHEGEWINGATLKQAMQRLNPAFDERNYKYERFKDFLDAQSDIARTRHDKAGGHLEVQGLSQEETPLSENDPEALLDRYLRFLRLERIRMTPTIHRSSIITQFYDLINRGPQRSLEELRVALEAYFEDHAPNKQKYVHETVYQLFRTNCFDFDADKSKYPPETRLWQKKVSLKNDIKDANNLLEICDKSLIKIIGQYFDSVDNLDRKVMARLLYGSAEQQKMLEHVTQLIETLK